MKVSVCIPAFEAEPFIGEAVASVLAQTERDWELVVVDDGSRDGTAGVVESFGDPRIRLVRHERNRGQSQAWNTAIRLAEAPLVKLLAADDLLHPDCLQRMLSVPADLVFCRREIVGEGLPGWRGRYSNVHEGFGPLEGVNDARTLFERWLAAGFVENWVGEPTVVLARRELLLRAGLFDPAVEGAVDLDLWARAFVCASSVGFVDDRLAVVRLHGASVTSRVHGGHRVSLDRARLLHGLLVFEDRPELRALRREAEIRVIKDFLRGPRRVPFVTYLRMRTRPQRSAITL